jgi:hypothetical protein
MLHVKRGRLALVVAFSWPLGGCNVAGVAVMAAIEPQYSPGTLAAEYTDRTHALATAGCFDLALSIKAASRPVLEWRMGNRCISPAEVDLSRLLAYDDANARVVLRDPNGEIGPRTVAPRREVVARIALETAPSARRICIDTHRIVSTTSGAPAPRPVCLQLEEDPRRWVAVGAGT